MAGGAGEQPRRVAGEEGPGDDVVDERSVLDDLAYGRIDYAEALRALTGGVADPVVDLPAWQADLDEQVDGRRRELLGERRIPGFERRAEQLREAGVDDQAAALRAFSDSMNGLTDGRIGSRVPERSPYQVGDRIMLRPGYATRDQAAFTGTVHGYLGSNLLTGLTDDGAVWSESWGSLQRVPSSDPATTVGEAELIAAQPDAVVDLAPPARPQQLAFTSDTAEPDIAARRPGPAARRRSARRDNDAQAVMTMRTAFELDALVILVDAHRNPAQDADLRAQLIESLNARDFTWAFADDEGIHHQVDGDLLHPEVTRSGLITWQRLWDRIGPGITEERVAELHAAITEGAEVRATQGPHMDQRLFSAQVAFYAPPPPPAPPDLDALVDDLVHGRVTRSAAFGMLLDHDAITIDDPARWEAEVEDRIDARRRELLGEDAMTVYEQRVQQLREFGRLGSSDAQVRAFQELLPTDEADGATTVDIVPDTAVVLPQVPQVRAEMQAAAKARRAQPKRFAGKTRTANPFLISREISPGEHRNIRANMLQPVGDQIPSSFITPSYLIVHGAVVDTVALSRLMGAAYVQVGQRESLHGPIFTYGPADGRGFVPETEPDDPLTADPRALDELANAADQALRHDGDLDEALRRIARGKKLAPDHVAFGRTWDQWATDLVARANTERDQADDGLSPQRGDRIDARPVVFQPASQDDLAPSTPLQRARANIAALRLLAAIEADDRAATADEQQILARWGGWGSVPQVFDAANEQWAWAREELAELLTDQERAAAARNTLNAHYTDARIVTEVWAAVTALGFTRGQVLEPGSGSGNYIGFAPPGAQMTGVELEPQTARISQLLYPNAQILNESFADTRAPRGAFDLTIGNVPFGKIVLHDPRHNPHGHSIHNHFMLKALDLTRPGGLMAMVVSAYTMDATGPAVRRELAQMADLIGAVRLPSRAHRAAAGTDALTDVLLFRRREADREPDSLEWELTQQVTIGEHTVRVNEYFIHHPQRVLGELSTDGSTLYREGELSVAGPVGDDLVEPLRAALAGIVAEAHAKGLTFAPSDVEPAAAPVALVGRSAGRAEGFIEATSEGTFTVVADGTVVPHEVPATQAAELRALLGLRDTTMSLLNAEAATLDDTDDITGLREQLNRRYDTYVQRYGPINRFTTRRTGRVDPQTGEDKLSRVRPPQGRFREDTYSAAVYALENFDPDSQTASKVDLFTQRVIAARTPRLGADAPEDALAIVMDKHGRVDLQAVADLLDADADDALAQLGELVYEDPASRQLVHAAEYLSGNVRAKLVVARTEAETDPRYEVNVTALEAVIPEELQPADIHAALGSVWISDTYVQQFLQELLDDTTIRIANPIGTAWFVDGGNRGGVKSREVWGTDRVPAVKIAAALLEQRQIVVKDNIGTHDRPHYVVNIEATAAAREKATLLNERFGEWVWEDPARATDLLRIYNDNFNGLVLRNYDNPHLTMPGLASTITLRPHQKAAVARIINEPAVLLAHEVGAGKTLEMVVGAMELRRLGLASKIAVVIPNHMIEQFGREWLQAYPQAKVLLASREDLSSAVRRRQFVARCATGDWDAVIMSRSAFERIPMSPDYQAEYMSAELKSMDEMLERLKASDESNRSFVKKAEKMRLQAEQRLTAKMDSTKDEGLSFEMMGVDYLMVDEAHGYKNLRTVSNIPGAAIDGSQRATDLHMKLEWLRATRGGRVVTFATATPIANSVTESYVVQRYLRPDLLDAAGIDGFDSWASTFGEVVTSIELSPEGSGFRQNARFAKFKNTPELLRMFWMAADVKTAEDLNLPVPLLAERASDGQRQVEIVSVPSIAAQVAFMGSLADRAKLVRERGVEPEEDNMLKISNDGRKAALDIRMVYPGYTPAEPQKIDVAAENIAAIWEATRGNAYAGAGGGEHPRLGSLQIVFCDLGTPGGEWSAYEELRRQLVERGMPREQIRFVHEAANDRAKGELFAACKDGRVAVLIGSSEKMGVGTNVQARAVALHHLDCPWKPAEVQQREGRIIRQGNLNPEAQIFRYVTEGSFDGYMWQTVARKQRFISQVMRGRLDVREIEDIGEASLSYNEVMAIATGNPLLLDKARAEAELHRLERLEKAYHNGKRSLDRRIIDADRTAQRANEALDLIAKALAVRKETAGDAFGMYVGDRYFNQRTEAGRALVDVLVALPYSSRPREVAKLGGFTVTAVLGKSTKGPTVILEFTDVPDAPAIATSQAGFVPASVTVLLPEISTSGAVGLVQRLENRLGTLERDQERLHTMIERQHQEAATARAQLGQPFRYSDEIRAAREEVARILEEMARQAAPPPPAEGAPGADTTGSTETGPATTTETETSPVGVDLAAIAERFEAMTATAVTAAAAANAQLTAAQRIQSHLLEAAEQPRPAGSKLPDADQVRALVGDTGRMIVSEDNRFFATHPADDPQRWTLHEATTGIPLASTMLSLRTRNDAEQALGVLAALPVDFAEAARMFANPPHVIEPGLRARMTQVQAQILRIANGEATANAVAAAPVDHDARIVAEVLERVNSPQATDEDKLWAYARLGQRYHRLSEHDKRTARTELDRIGDDGTPMQRSAAQHALEGFFDPVYDTQAQILAVTASGLAFRNDPAERLRRYSELEADTFAGLHERHRLSILDDLAQIAASGEPNRNSTGPAQYVINAGRLLRTLDPPPSAPQTIKPGQLRLVIEDTQVWVYGTDKQDLKLRAMLRDSHLTWFPSKNAWGFQRHLRAETKSRGLRTFQAAIAQAGRQMEVQDLRRQPADRPPAVAPAEKSTMPSTRWESDDPAVARLRDRLATRADATAAYPAPLPQPAELRELARFEVIVSDDERFFARQTSRMSVSYWELREATTGLLLTTPRFGLRDEAAARRGLAVLTGSGVDFAQFAEALAANGANGIAPDLRERVATALKQAHSMEEAAGNGAAPVGSAYTQPLGSALTVPRQQREDRAALPGLETADRDAVQR